MGEQMIKARALRPGDTIAVICARGPLVGGNLSLICATIGTPREIETRDREDERDGEDAPGIHRPPSCQSPMNASTSAMAR